MKTKLTILLLLLTVNISIAQTIFQENMGTPIGTTSITVNSFQNTVSLSYSNGGQSNSADIRNTSGSSGYSGASGAGNVFFTATAGAYGFSMEGINASNYTSLSLQYGYRKEGATVHATFSVDYWNGSAWATIANSSSALFNEAAGATAGWYLAKSISLPSDAQISGLKIRFVKTGTTSIRIDDVKLVGTEIPPTVSTTTVSSIASNSVTFGGNVSATGGSSITGTGTVYAATATNANPTVGGAGVTNLSTSSPNSGTGSFTNTSGSVLSPNVQYSYAAYATKSTGLKGYGSVNTFYSLAVTPSAPIVNSPSGTSLHIAIGSDSNSTATTYAIYETSTGTYVQSNGSLGTTAVYQTTATWGTQTVSGLSPTTTYTFKVLAKNGAGVPTSAGSSANGTTLVVPAITASGALSALNTIYGTPSSYTTFLVGGTNLTDNIVITAPTGFEISKTSGGATGYAAAQTLIPNSGLVSSTTIYVRLSGSAYGTFSGNVIVVSSNDVLTVNVPTVSSSVAKLGLTITGINALNKVCDGYTNSYISGIATLNGVLASDSGNVTLVTSAATANFADALVGSGKMVTIAGYTLNGSASVNYNLIQPTGLSADITPNIGSDVVLNSGSPTSNNDTINYQLFQGSQLSNTTSGTNGCTGVMGFYVRDGGAGADADTLPTELTAITFNVTNPDNILSARLFSTNAPLGQVVSVNGNSQLVFTGLSNEIIAPDNDKIAINLRVTFKPNVIDNQQMQFTIASVTAKADGSIFTFANGGGASSKVTGDINRVKVMADHLVFDQQPTSGLYVGTTMSPSPTVVAKDSFGSVDLDFANSVSIVAMGATLATSPQTKTANSGTATFDSISFTTSGNGVGLTASSTGLTSATSNSFVITPLILPTFTPITPICYGNELAVLPTTSTNGITGTWQPALNNTITTTYTFTPNGGQYAASTTLTIIVNPVTAPAFDAIVPICFGAPLNSLPTSSINGITGSWGPDLNNTVTTTYIFTPQLGQCSTQGTLSITVIPKSTPNFEDIRSICAGSAINLLPIASLEGITGAWTPVFDNTVTNTYTFTPDAMQCAENAELTVIVNQSIIPTFEEIAPICSDTTQSVLPTTSQEGITGIWSPQFNPNETTTYTFTPDSGQCAGSTSLTIVVNPSITPLFNEVTPICLGGTLSNLQTTSLNGITGTWSPDVDETVTTTYTFTPDGGQCAKLAVLTVVVNPTIPLFNEVTPICVGGILNALPTTSLNGINGVWSPDLDNTATTTYTFIPDEGQCASNTTLTITVNATSPLFEAITQICSGTNVNTLPTISTNGVTGIWTIDSTNTERITYTFTPDSGQCASNIPLTFVAVPNITPTFQTVAPVEHGQVMNDLPITSNNGIDGIWSPTLNNEQTTTYTFTPNNGQCATTTTLAIEIIPSRNTSVTPGPTTTSFGASNEVGVTAGELSVSSSGGAQYNIPIAVPPGINGVVPQIGLSYNSQGGAGIAGYGWNITGLSTITRIGATKFHDDIIDPVNFDSFDRFSLDGQRLMLKSGTYGVVNSVYETENFSNTKVTFLGTYFKVEYPDGTQALYGFTSDSKVSSSSGTLTYALKQWTNPQGVTIIYNYTQAYNSLHIYSIKYGNTTSSSTQINEIQFVYKNRTTPNQGFVGGIDIKEDKILSLIKVFGNNVGYRNYLLNYDAVLGYDRLISITEKNGDGSKSYNPTVFEYYNDTNPEDITRFTKPDFRLSNSSACGYTSVFPPKIINGDFDGDGDQDFIWQDKLYTKITDTATNPTVTCVGSMYNQGNPDNIVITSGVPVKCLKQYPDGFKLMNKDAWCLEESSIINYNKVIYKTYSFNTGTNSVDLEGTKEITLNPSVTYQSFTGDFNGDGITDKLVMTNEIINTYIPSTGYTIGYEPVTHNSEFYFVNLDSRMTSNYVKDLGQIQSLTRHFNSNNYSYGNSLVYIADVNGDGKSDIITFKGSLNKIVVYSLDNNDNLVQLWETPINFVIEDSLLDFDFGARFFVLNKEPVLGDLNGDGKDDILLLGHDKRVLMSTGISFVSEGLPSDIGQGEHMPVDFNNDGKMDLLQLNKTSRRSFSITNYSRLSPGNWTSIANSFSNPDQCDNPILDISAFMVKSSKVYPGKPQLLMLENYHNNPCINNYDIGFYTNQKTFVDSKLIKSITLGNGVKDIVNYMPLADGNGVYTSAGQTANYPAYDINNAPAVKLVSEIDEQSSTNFKKQVYKYYGATTDVGGLGFLGFRALLKTNWHDTNTTPISSITKFDVNLRGAVIESFSLLGLASPTLVFQTSNPYIARTLFSYNNNYADYPILANKVFKLRNTFSQNFNGLEETITDVSSEYDAYNLRKKTTLYHNSNPDQSKSTVEEYFYDDLPLAEPYFIGRPKSKKATTTLISNGDSSISEEEYTYNNNLLQQIKKRTRNSGLISHYILETNGYDSYGNITSKTISAPEAAPPIASKTSTFAYDTTTHRFLTKKTDTFGLETNYTYDMSKGLLLTELLPSSQSFPIKTSYAYDSWGKRIQTINYLGSSVSSAYNETYTNITGGIVKTTLGNDGSGTKLILDDLGRKVHEQKKDINDNWSCVTTTYDINDRPLKISQPYFTTVTSASAGNFSVWNEMHYDVYGRLQTSNNLKSNSSNGKELVYSYDGLTTTIDEGQRHKEIVKDLSGNVISLNETGAVGVTNTYFANGNLATTIVGGAVTTIMQDGWGRKKYLDDSSAGTYKYSYNDFNELLSEEVVGKGTTKYTLDSYGRVSTKLVTGSNADTPNTTTTYTYDDTTKALNYMLFFDSTNNNRIIYHYYYDDYRRLKTTTEKRTSFFEFQKEYAYDNLGRIDREHFFAKDLSTTSTKTSDKWIKTIYKNGYKFQLYDMINSTSIGSVRLWQTNTSDAQGNVLTASLGNGTTIKKTYDSSGFPSLIELNQGSSNIMSLLTQFDHTTGNLKRRKYSFFNWDEILTYDALDRLVSYKDPAITNPIVPLTQNYNDTGTIASNYLGAHAYDQNKPYNLTSITPTDQTPNSPILNYYTSRTQDIAYNIFKSPTWITELGQENINFEYNALNSRSVMYYGNDQSAINSRSFKKFYSADGSMEIKRKIAGDVDVFVTYIGGDAYTAPLILRSTGTIQSYFYLHRDYQGSILGISNNNGTLVEKRLFDVWGALIRYNSNSITTPPTTTYGLFLDRGYTGHELLLGVGLINMNGRIYDPKLHRFLQPDNNIQDPLNTQNYNRYGYCMNNPTRYTDPSGESWLDFVGFLFSSYIHGAQATGDANPLDWNAGQLFNAIAAPTSQLVTAFTTNFANNYIDTYNTNINFGSGSSSTVDSHSYIHNIFNSTWDNFKYNYLNFTGKMQDGSYRSSLERVKGITGGTEALIAAKQLKVIDIREARPVIDQIGNVARNTTKFERTLKLGGEALGKVNIGLDLYFAGCDINEYNEDKISGARLTYRLSSTVASIGTSAGVSASAGSEGGPLGVLAGFFVGIASSVGEMVYDGWNNTVIPVINQGTYEINNNQGWTNFHP